MKRLVFLLSFLLSFSSLAAAQGRDGTSSSAASSIRAVSADPTGAACSPSTTGAAAVRIYNGGFYICSGGVYVVGSGSGGTTINSTNGQLPYRVNSTTFGDSAFASNALNSTYLQATSGASGAGVTLAVAGGGTNENLILTPKGTGGVQLSAGSTGPPAIGWDNGGVFNLGFYKVGSDLIGVATSGGNYTRFTNNAIILRSDARLSLASSTSFGAPDTAFERASSSTARISNASTGAGQLLIGQSTDTVSAQLDVRSQSTTRPAARFQAASTTSGTQEMLGVYDGSGTDTTTITAGGTLTTVAVTSKASTNLAVVSGTSSGLYLGGGNVFGGQLRLEPAIARFGSGVAVQWSSDSTSYGTSDLYLYRDAANTLAQRNGTNAQTFRIYESYTDISNYRRLLIQMAPFGGGGIGIILDAAGSGVLANTPMYVSNNLDGPVVIRTNNTNRWQINSSGHFLTSIDNTYDIGASGANRPRNIYAANAVSAAGVVDGLAVYASASDALGWVSRSRMYSTSNGDIRVSNSSGTDFNLFQFGGTSASFPALQRSGTSLKVRLADNSDDAPLTTFTVKTKALTVATLPSAATAGAGARAFVTDANTTFILGIGTAVVGGGANSVPVYSDGTNWLIG